jgi:outer membrane protein assembly factor BamB
MRQTAWFWLLCAVGCGGAPPAEATDETPSNVAPVPTRKGGSDWPRFLGPTGDSVSTEKGILAPWPAEGLRVVWQTPVGTGYSVPSISRGRLFLFDRHDNQARLTCRNSETGAFLWKFEYRTDYEDYYGYNNGPRCCPVVDDDRVYVYGAEGMLHCVKAADGSPVWKVDTKADFGVVQNFFGVGSTPVLEGDLLLVQVGGSPPGADLFRNPKGNGSGVVAFDKRTGKVRYRLSDELASYASPVLATVGSRRWCFVLARGGLLGFEPASGKLDFHFPWRARELESVNAANPVVIGDRVLISETYGPGSALLKVKEGGYDVLWSDAARDRRDEKSLQCHWNTPIHHDGYVYASSGRHQGNAELRCVELTTGKVMWSQPDLTRCSLLMVDGHFVCLSEVGQLLLLKVNPQKYEEVSTTDLNKLGALPRQDRTGRVPRDPWWAAPVLSHGLLYLRGDNRLVCLELIPQPR